MTLFDYIFQWFSNYVFNTNGFADDILADVTFPIGGTNMTLSSWLSATATIITLCFLVAFLFLCVRWLFKVVAGLFTLRG